MSAWDQIVALQTQINERDGRIARAEQQIANDRIERDRCNREILALVAQIAEQDLAAIGAMARGETNNTEEKR